jgi:hypothetical protein
VKTSLIDCFQYHSPIDGGEEGTVDLFGSWYNLLALLQSGKHGVNRATKYQIVGGK